MKDKKSGKGKKPYRAKDYKNERDNLEHFAKRCFTPLKIGIFVAGVAAASLYYTFSFYLPNYYTSKITEREELATRCSEKFNFRGAIYSLDLSSMSAWDKMRYTRKLEESERSIENNIQGFIQFVEKDKRRIAELARFPIEKYGEIKKDGDTFSLDNIKDNSELINYMEEILNNDFTHKQQTIDYSELYYYFFGRNFSEILAVMEQYVLYTNMPDSERNKIKNIVLIKKSGNISVLPIEETKRIYEEGHQFLKLKIEDVKDVSFYSLNKEFFNSNLFALFHTHPYRGENEPNKPSPMDRSGSYINGPSIVFNVFREKLHVYLVDRCNSREIYTTALSKKENLESIIR